MCIKVIIQEMFTPFKKGSEIMKNCIIHLPIVIAIYR